MTGRRLSLFILLIAVICFASPVFAASKKSAPQKKSVIPVEMDYASLVEKVLPSVVRITTERSAGSGFFVSSKGEILTNYHVIEGAKEIFVTMHNSFPGTAIVKDIDKEGDMALLVFKTLKATPFLKISDTLPKQGEAVMAVGNPQGFEDTVSNGIVSAFRQKDKWIQFTAPVSPGSSGGVLVNSSGEVVGMTTSVYKEGQNLNFAISSKVLKEFFSHASSKPMLKPEPKFDAIKNLHVAAIQGDAETQNFLGYAYHTGDVTVNGITISRDEDLALYWYQKAAEQGHTEAQSQLAAMFYSGNGVKQDYQQAAYWGIRAAKSDNAQSQYIIGLMYYFARGFNRDYQQARYWFIKAAEKGYSNAQINLAIMYYNGEGVEKDYRQAIHWYQKAAQQGNNIAQLRLGYMYEDGEGVNPDINQAIYWYRQSAKQGNNDAKNILAKFGIYNY